MRKHFKLLTFSEGEDIVQVKHIQQTGFYVQPVGYVFLCYFHGLQKMGYVANNLHIPF